MSGGGGTATLTIDGRDIGVRPMGRVCRITAVSHVNDLAIAQLDTLIERLVDARAQLHAHAAQHIAQQLAQLAQPASAHG